MHPDETTNTTGTEQQDRQPTFIDDCQQMRAELKGSGIKIKKMMNHPAFDEELPEGAEYGEMKANLVIAYRSTEDAIMRMGKAIQAFDGGVSCYKK